MKEKLAELEERIAQLEKTNAFFNEFPPREHDIWGDLCGRRLKYVSDYSNYNNDFKIWFLFESISEPDLKMTVHKESFENRDLYLIKRFNTEFFK